MTRYDINTEGLFHTVEETLEDGSTIHDVYFSGPDGQAVITEPASETAAEELANALNRVRDRFLDCGSDREVSSLAYNLGAFMARYK